MNLSVGANTFLTALAFCQAALVLGHNHGHHDRMSRHLQSSTPDLTDIIMILDAPVAAGPFDEEADDYVDSPDMTLAARAGFEGLATDRLSVTNAIPLTLNLTVFKLQSSSASAATTASAISPLEGTQVQVWHTDAAGVYSAIDGNRQPREDTSNQKWCRSVQTTNADGAVSFNTILAGWYPGRAIHYHIRFQLAGQEGFIATSQLFVADLDLMTYQDSEPYVFNTQPVTPLMGDGLYGRLDSAIRDALTLDLVGDQTTGFTAALSIGLALEEEEPVPTASPVAAAPIAAPTSTLSPPTITVTSAPTGAVPTSAAIFTPATAALVSVLLTLLTGAAINA